MVPYVMIIELLKVSGPNFEKREELITESKKDDISDSMKIYLDS